MHRHVVAMFVMLSVVVILVTTHYSAWSMRIIQQRLLQSRGWQKKKNLSQGGRKVTWCWCLPHWTWAVGTLWTPPWLPPAQDVCPWHSHRAEGTWPCHLLWQVGAITCARLRGRAINDRTCPCKLNEQRDSHNLLGCIPVVAAAGEISCDVEMGEHLCQEIQDSIKECLWHKWDPAAPEESRCPTSTPRHDHQAEYSAHIQANYDQPKDTMWGSCEEALAVARDAH